MTSLFDPDPGTGATDSPEKPRESETTRENALGPAEREALVTENVGLARYIARQTARMDPLADRDNLTGEALLMLTESAKTWDPAAGTAFDDYVGRYLRCRLGGMVKDDYRRHGQRITRGADVAAVADHRDAGGAADPDARVPDAFDRELLSLLRPAARDIVTAVAFEGVSPAMAADRFGMPVKDVLLVCRNAAKFLAKAKVKLDKADLTDFAEAE